MKIRILRVDQESTVFAPLVEAMTAAGMRCGWLDLERAAEPPPALEVAAGLGMLRAVAAVDDRVVVVKPVRGGFILRDLLREHFRGCQLVLTRGEVEAAELRQAAGGEGWMIRGAGADEVLSTDELVENLRKPKWPASPG